MGDAGCESPDVDARRIVEQASGFEGPELHRGLGEPATVRGVAALDAMVGRRIGGEPLQYVVGRWGFRQLDLMVDRRVLIPRPETEHLIEVALGLHLPAEPRILDIGTGSGCLAVTLLAEITRSRVVATDVSPAALSVAEHNARRHYVGERMALVAADLAAA
ncbi:MAG: class I SAM-dependent methyltransferase, partial [Acidimicrobiales bacterium]